MNTSVPSLIPPIPQKFRSWLIILSVILTNVACLGVAWAQTSHLFTFFWSSAIVLVVLGTWTRSIQLPYRIPSLTPRALLFIGVFLLPLCVRLAFYNPLRFHGDDLLTAYFSNAYKPWETSFFSGLPPNSEWVTTFPTMYFFLQKIVFIFTGLSLNGVKLSVAPYIIIVSIMTYLVAKRLTNFITALSAVFLYAFMAISVYHETLGLHFVSSTASYLIFFYALILTLQKPTPGRLVMTGITCGFCYLFYTSSYIALPVLIIGITLASLQKRKMLFSSFGWALLGFVITLGPFITYASTVDNYFFARVGQVSLVAGTKNQHKDEEVRLPQMLPIFAANTISSLRSFIFHDVGGAGGYTFDNRAFFPRVSLLYFIVGVLTVLILLRSSISWWLILVTLVITFITGMALLAPPPGYHRLTIILPFISIVSAVPIYFLTKKHSIPTIVWTLIAVALLLYAWTNVSYLRPILAKEAQKDEAKLMALITQKYPNRHVHIAAFPGFAFEKELPFFGAYSAKTVDTGYHIDYLTLFNRNEPYVYVMIFPDEFHDEFKAADPAGTYYRFSDNYGLFVNEGVQP